MIALPDITLLERGGATYGPAAVLGMAALTGSLLPLWEDVGRREAARPELDTPALQAALDGFRGARGLTAADEFKAWMAARNVDLDDVADHLERRASEAGDGWADPATLLWGELVCAGKLDRLMWDLARVLGVHAIHAAQGASAPPPLELEAASATLLTRLPLSESERAWFAAAAAVYREREAEVLADDRLLKLLQTRRLDLVHFDLDLFRTPDLDVAREILLCLRVERRSVDEVGRLAGLAPERVSDFTTAFSRPLQRELLAAAPGAVLGPFPDKGGHVVARLRARKLPSLDQPSVRGVLMDLARRDAFPGATAGVRWLAWAPVG